MHIRWQGASGEAYFAEDDVLEHGLRAPLAVRLTNRDGISKGGVTDALAKRISSAPFPEPFRLRGAPEADR